MAKKKTGYQIEEALLEAFADHVDRTWAKPLEDIVAAAMLAYLRADEETQKAIRGEYKAWVEAGAAAPCVPVSPLRDL